MSKSRYDVIPSRMTLLAQKQRLSGAVKGHKLLKQKADALNMKFRKILKQIRQKKTNIISEFKKSNFSLSEAKFNSGDISMSVIESVRSAQNITATKVRIDYDNVAGVRLPVFDEIVDERRKDVVDTSRGGFYVQKCKSTFAATLSSLVELASLQTSFLTLEEAIKITNRRVNALDKVVIPKIHNTISYIESELDELEREEKFKLKKIGKKKEKLKKEKLEESGRKMKEGEIGPESGDGAVTSGSIMEDDDEDIVVDDLY